MGPAAATCEEDGSGRLRGRPWCTEGGGGEKGEPQQVGLGADPRGGIVLHRSQTLEAI